MHRQYTGTSDYHLYVYVVNPLLQVPQLRQHVQAIAAKSRLTLLKQLAKGLSHFVVSAGRALINQGRVTEELGPAIKALYDAHAQQLHQGLDELLAEMMDQLIKGWVKEGLGPRLMNGAGEEELGGRKWARRVVEGGGEGKRWTDGG